MEIWVVGHVALSETIKIYKNNKLKCQEYFSKSFIRDLDKLAKQCDNEQTVRILPGTLETIINDKEVCENAAYISEATDNMHWALWNMKEELGVGFVIDEKKMPVLQETVEVLQLFKIDYFEGESKGCYLIVGDFPASALGAHATCIGHTKKGHAGDIVIDDRIRHISRPAKIRCN